MHYNQITVRELEEILAKIEDKDKLIEVNTNCVRGIGEATSVQEYENSVLIG